jgi:hypothetical protein
MTIREGRRESERYMLSLKWVISLFQERRGKEK